MKTTRIWANLAVTDLSRTTDFYTKLGFTHNGSSAELTSFLFGTNDLIIHFFLKDVLQPATLGDIIDSTKGNEIIFTLSADTREEVREWASNVKAAGGDLISEPSEFGPGYYGFVFTDPDGHKFNVFHM